MRQRPSPRTSPSPLSSLWDDEDAARDTPPPSGDDTTWWGGPPPYPPPPSPPPPSPPPPPTPPAADEVIDVDVDGGAGGGGLPPPVSLPPPPPPPLGHVMPGVGQSANQRPQHEALAAASASGQTVNQAGREWAQRVLSDGGQMVWPAPENSSFTFVASKRVLQLGISYHQLITLLGLSTGWSSNST